MSKINEVLMEAISELPREHRQKIHESVAKNASDSARAFLEGFLEQYEDDHVFDMLVATTLARIGHQFNQSIDDRELDFKRDKGDAGRLITIIMTETLENVAKDYKKASAHLSAQLREEKK